MTGLLYGVAQFCVRRRFVVLGVWFVLTVALVAVSHQLGGNTNDNLSLPGTDSQRATDALAESFPSQAHDPLTPQGASALSKDQSTGYLSVTLKVSPGSLSTDQVQTIIDAADPAKAAGLQVETGGPLGQKVSKPSTESSEWIGIIAAMVILTFTFGRSSPGTSGG